MKKEIIIVVLLTFFLILFAAGTIFLNNKFNNIKHKSKFLTTPSITSPPLLKGEIYINPDSNQYTTVNSSIELIVVADSKNYPIVGYDLDIKYDKNFLKFEKAINSSSDFFDLFSSEKDDSLVITGIKKLTSKETIYLEKKAMVSLQFKTLKRGKTEIFLIRKDHNKNDSNLITENNEDILDKTNNSIIFIGESVSLKKNQSFVIDNNLKISLKDLQDQQPDCRDCLVQVNLIVETNGQSKELNFKSGGFAGLVIDRLSAFGHLFLLKELKNNQVIFFIYET